MLINLTVCTMQYVSINHYIQRLSQEITVVWVETSLSGPFMSSQKTLCNSLPLFCSTQWAHSNLEYAACSWQPFRRVRGTAEQTLHLLAQAKTILTHTTLSYKKIDRQYRKLISKQRSSDSLLSMRGKSSSCTGSWRAVFSLWNEAKSVIHQ